MNTSFKYSFLLIVSILVACTESFVIETQDFSSALVVEATISNEVKSQEIRLSKAFKLEEEGPFPETNAQVEVKDENSNTYVFTETSPGVYTSSAPFSTQNNTNYTLHIKTASGAIYESKPTKTTSNSQIESINVSLGKSIANEDEFRLNINSYDPTGISKYYRYTYEETYKIVAQNWSPLELAIVSRIPSIVERRTKIDQSKEVCYQTLASTDIIQTETTDKIEDRVSNFLVRNILTSDFKTGHRYSILIKQFVQSYEAHTYYEVLKKFSNNSNVLAQSQPGFFSSNIEAKTENGEKVLGFFEVTSVSSKRFFFNYRDFYEKGRPPYLTKCETLAPLNRLSTPMEEPPVPLILALETGNWLYFKDNDNADENNGPYLLTSKDCGDCTAFGTTVKPIFWED